jgi:hypothetical protein
VNNLKQQKKRKVNTGSNGASNREYLCLKFFLKNDLTEYSLFLFPMAKMFLPLSVVDAKGRPICVSSGFEL